MENQFDVAVVGLGPVGMTAAALLGRAGHRVVALERYDGPYNLPRAATFDDETMRTFARLGIADSLLPHVQYQPSYEWCNADGELLIEYRYAEAGRSGWAEWYQMHQPDVEDALLGACRRAGVDIRFATEVVGYRQDAEGVTVETAHGPVHVAYVIAADGGNGLSRDAIGTSVDDLGFSEPWMVCDFRYDENPGLPLARQVGDPARPTSIIGLGPHHHRFSFMLESVDDFPVESDPDKVWQRVSAHLRPGDAELIRVATYTFRSLLADRWRDGRILLAGDAAHQMPPFLGQGMCSGIRDAQNIAFKLDLVLRGLAGDELLDTYQRERLPHVEWITRKGIELGRIQTTRDPEAAAARDQRLIENRLARRKPEMLRLPGLGEGLLAADGSPGRGSLMPQGRLARDGRTARFDELVAPGFQLIVRDPSLLDGDRTMPLVDVVVLLLPEDDVDGVYTEWFDAHEAQAVLVRPDAYVFGSAADADSLDRLLGEFATELAPTRAALYPL